MNNLTKLFRDEVANVPDDVRREVELSFAIADKIDAILKEKGMTQKELAQKMHKSENEVSRWLGGTHNFTLRTIAKISSALQTPILSVD